MFPECLCYLCNSLFFLDMSLNLGIALVHSGEWTNRSKFEASRELKK